MREPMSVPPARRSRRSLKLNALYTACLVFGLAFVWFSVRASRAWLGSGFVDPVGHFGAQDEAVYSRVVLEMLANGRWLVPTFLGRLAYFKPPLLYWLSAAGVKSLGASAYSLRLPSILSAAGAAAIAWSWIRRQGSVWPALATVILITTDYYWVMMSSLNMTDAPLVFFGLAAIWLVSGDLQLQRRPTLWLTAICLAAATLTKSAAAAPTIVTIVVCARNSRVWILLGVAAALASPWFVYTSLTHSQWFWDEHVVTELLGNSRGANPMPGQESNPVFYASRLFFGDPLIAWSGAAALIVAVWKRIGNKLVTVWMLCNCAAILLFRYHAAPYLLPIVTGLALMVGLVLARSPSQLQMFAVVAVALAGGMFLLSNKNIVWKGTNILSARALEAYCEQGRDNGLLILEPDDEYFSSVLPLTKVVYGVIDPGNAPRRPGIDWRDLGVIVSGDQFEDQGKWWPVFGARLARMGLNTSAGGWRDPRATGVLIHDTGAASEIINAHPELDFFVPSEFAAKPGQHIVEGNRDGRAFLMAKTKVQHPSARPDWSCRAPLP